MKLKFFCAVVFSAFIGFALVACGDEYDPETKTTTYLDYSVESIPSIWKIGTKEYVGEKFGVFMNANDNSTELAQYDLSFLYFGEDGKCKSYRCYYNDKNNNVDVVSYDYKTDDNLHFDMLNNAILSKWSFAVEKEDDSYGDIFFYTDSVKSGRTFHYYHPCEEIRHDSILYMWAPQLRGMLSVPKDRVVKSTDIVGNFYGEYEALGDDMSLVEGVSYRRYYHFNENGSFTMEKDVFLADDEYFSGKYSVKEGDVDILELTFEDGTKESFPFVMYMGKLYMYDEDGARKEFN